VRLLAIAGLFFFVGSLASIIRYKWVIARGMRIKAPLLSLLTLSHFSFGCGYFAPISVAGEVFRMGFTKRRLGISYLNSLKLAVLDRLFGLAGVIACAALLIPLSFLADSVGPCLQLRARFRCIFYQLRSFHRRASPDLDTASVEAFGCIDRREERFSAEVFRPSRYGFSTQIHFPCDRRLRNGNGVRC
jgi:hypothetical protein